MDFFQARNLIEFPFRLIGQLKRMKKTLIDLDLGIYWFWAGLRIALTLLPQTGYIHPDEYFQTVEVFAGDVFDTEISLPWEFNATFPIRSVPLIFTFFYFPFSILKRISEFVNAHAGFSILSHYTLFVVPRLSMCLLSFISDVCLFKICYQFCQNYKERLIIYASSFVCLVFMTRTFTNTLEMACFNILLYLVASCMAESEKVNYQSDFLKDKYSEASTISDRVKVMKLMKLLPKHSLKRCIPISVATVSGFFNRPTFVLYAITPLFYWFQRGLNLRENFMKDFHLRIFVFLLYCIPAICFFIYFDSAYYGYITWGEILNFRIGTNNFVVTPLNFIKYNLDPLNLSKHGLHPRFLHFLINIPLLFNVLGLSGLIVIAKLLYRGSLSNWTLLPKSQSITGMMTLSFVVPVLGLSVFPHQEPRFIAPVLLPLIFLYSHLVRDFEEHAKTIVPFRKRHLNRSESSGMFKYPLKCIDFFERATVNFDNRYNVNGRYLTNLKKREVVAAGQHPNPGKRQENRKADRQEEKEDGERREGKKKDLIKLWYLFNGFCVFFFGFLHQGGIYGLTRDFHQKLLVKPKYTTYHLITSHVYSLPLHLLAVKRNHRYKKNASFMAHEMGSNDLGEINSKLITVLRLAESRKKSIRRNYKVFYALPGTLFEGFRSEHRYYAANYSYQIREVFYPHFSAEAPPKLALNFADESALEVFDCTLTRYLIAVLRKFGLILIEITLPV